MPTVYAYSVVCDIGGYEFVSYSQEKRLEELTDLVVCDIGGYEFVSYSQVSRRSARQEPELFVI